MAEKKCSSEVSLTLSSAGSSSDDILLLDDAEMALSGMNMLLNNNFDSARELFYKYKDESPLMHSGYSFVFFMQALMSFEEDKLEEAVKVLQTTEKTCEIGDGIVNSIRKKLFRRKKQGEERMSTEERIQREVIIADCLLYQAILVFTNQDIPSYIRGGWYLRKAWKRYEKLHKEMLKLTDKLIGSKSGVLNNNAVITDVSAQQLSDGNEDELSPEIKARLVGAVNFGYGTFQLCISMVPPKILKLIEFLGFEGDRSVGLKSLQQTSNSRDMKAPLATLGLLWYHTVLRPFFALDGANDYNAGILDAEEIIDTKEIEFPHSSLFLFFRGRIHRLKRQTDLSLEKYQQALEAAAGERECELMCQYEIGWCNLVKLKWDDSLIAFIRLKEESKWSKCYYCYLVAVCLGAMGDLKGAHEAFSDVPGLLKKKNNQIEAFVSRRAEKMTKKPVTQEHCCLLTLELVFLWHTLPTCTPQELKPYLDVCDMQTDPKVFHLKCLLEGAVYKELGENEMAIQCLKESIARHQGLKEDLHVAAFSMFELASLYSRNLSTAAKGKAILQEIKEFKDYDFENRLIVRVNNSLKKLKENGPVS
ncbi:hypothetical protein ScPMuIL_008185 [Solemya velum]